MGDPIRGGMGVAITESACLNCHGAPETQADSEQNLPYALRRYGASSQPSPSECSAQASWPPELMELQSQLWTLPFWVRSNFENALQAQRKKEGMTALPFRIDVGKATVDLDLRPHSFIGNIGFNGKVHSLEVLASPKARISSHWDVENNQLMVGARNLLETEGIEIHGPWGSEFTPGRVLRNEAGEIRLQSDHNWLAGLGLWWKDIDFNNDQLLNAWIPAPFRNSIDPKNPDAIPEKYQLEDLLLNVFELLQHKKPAKKKLDLSGLLSPNFLKPGSFLRFDIDELKDLFIPNLLDLGPSKGELILQVDGRHNLNLTLEDFDIRLEAMDYPLSLSGERKGLRLKAGRVQAGEPVEVAHQGIIRPGVHLVRSTATGNWEMEVNLKLDLELEDGRKLKTHALFKGGLLNTPQGLQAAPQFYVSLRETDFTNKKGKPIWQNSKLEINGIANPITWPYRPFIKYLSNEARINLDLTLGNGQKVKLQSFANVAQNEFGAVEWRGLLHGLDMMTQIDYLVAEKVRGNGSKKELKETNYRTQLRLLAEPPRQEKRAGEEVFSFGIEAELDSQDLEKNKAANILQGLLGHLDIFVNEDMEFRGAMEIKADTISFPGVMKKGLFFHNPAILVEVDEVKFSKALWTATFPKLILSVALNPNGSKHGMIRGLGSIAQKEGMPFRVQWRPPEKQLSIEGLDWKTQLTDVMFDSDWNVSLLKNRIFGGDARLQIDYWLNTQGEMRNWHGSGKILVLGDEDGEIYLINSQGKRVGAPILRKTHWLFGKLLRIDEAGGYPLVDTKLVTRVNFTSLSAPEPDLKSKLEAAGLGPEWYKIFAEDSNPGQTWESGETTIQLGYNNQPFSLQGFRYRVIQYLQSLGSSDLMTGGQP